MSAKRIISFIMSIVIAVTAFVPTFAYSRTKSDVAFDRPEIMTLSEYKAKLREEGFPVITTEQFLKVTSFFSSIFRFITGRIFLPQENFDVSFDELVSNACNTVYNDCGLDIVSLLSSIPDFNDPARIAVEVFDIDTDTIRDEMYNKRDEAIKNNDDVMYFVYYFLGAYLAIIEKCTIYGVPTKDPNVYRVEALLYFKDGTTDSLDTAIYINVVTGECTNKDGSGLAGTGFNFNLHESLVYATIDSWMRKFGFCVFYDIAANSMPLLWHYITRRFTFEYDGLEWMIQIWKGNYLITNGGEVGVYNREPGTFGTFYNCATDDQLMEMSLQVYHGDDLLVNQAPQMHWWINGFQMSKRLYIPNSLTMKFSILMPDEEMLKAFCESIDNHYRHDVKYTVEGLKVNVVW